MAQFPCLPLWTDALLADTSHLSDAEFGRYMRMLILIWRTPGCRVPNDDAWLTRHLPRTPTIEDIRATVFEYCQTDGNFITQKRLKREFVDRFEFGGRMSALAKRRKNKTNGASSSCSTADAVPPKPKPKHISEPIFPTAATPPTVAEEQQPNSARSFASAPNGGALAREPDSQPAESKQVAEGKQGMSPDFGDDYRSPPRTKSDHVLAPLPDKQPPQQPAQKQAADKKPAENSRQELDAIYAARTPISDRPPPERPIKRP